MGRAGGGGVLRGGGGGGGVGGPGGCGVEERFFSGFTVHDLGLVDEKIDFGVETFVDCRVYVVVVVVVLLETGFYLVVVFAVVF